LSGMMPAEAERRRQAAAELAAELNTAKLEQPLGKVFLDQTAGPTARAAAARALMTLNPPAHLRELGDVLRNADEAQKLRADCARALAESSQLAGNEIVAGALTNAPHSLQTQLALALASNTKGAEALLDSVEHGKASPRLLQNRTIKDRLVASKPLNLTV